jgi:hypothetical protein
MSLIIRDSFDFAKAVGDLGQNFWDIADTTQTFLDTSTRFGVGQCLGMPLGTSSGQVALSKAFATNESTVFVGGAFIYPTGFSGSLEVQGLRFYDGSTVQCSIIFTTGGDIKVYRGDRGTLLGTYAGAWSANAWTHMQFKVVIDGTAGEFHIRKNGNTVDDYTLTGVNNRSTANNYANKWDTYKVNSSPPSNIKIDDLAIWSGSGSGNWSDWMGDFRAVQIMPNADTTDKHFTPNAATIVVGNPVTGGSRTFNADVQETVGSINSTFACTVSKATLNFNSAATGHVNVAIFDALGGAGAPGSVITNGTATAVTNPASGLVDFVFATPPTLAANTLYWVMVIPDASIVLKNTGGANVTQYSESRTYASGFHSPMAATGGVWPLTYSTLTTSPSGNFAYVQEPQEDGSLTFLTDHTPGDFDLYANGGLPTTPLSIFGVSVRAFMCKSDAGARTGTIRLKSNTTSVDGATAALSTTFQNLVMYQDTDPDTSATWTATAVGNLKFGPKVVA